MKTKFFVTVVCSMIISMAATSAQLTASHAGTTLMPISAKIILPTNHVNLTGETSHSSAGFLEVKNLFSSKAYRGQVDHTVHTHHHFINDDGSFQHEVPDGKPIKDVVIKYARDCRS